MNSEKYRNGSDFGDGSLTHAGVTLETLKDLKEKINGNAYGFGELRPWTEEERKSLEE